MPYMHTIHVGTLYVYASHVGRSLEVVIANNNNNNLIVFQNNDQSHHFSELIIVQHIRMKFLSIKKRKKIHIAHLLTCMPYTCAIYVCRMLICMPYVSNTGPHGNDACAACTLAPPHFPSSGACVCSFVCRWERVRG